MTDRAGRTPLHYAALAGDLDAVAAEVGGGADVDAADAQGFTPLHFAAQECHPGAAQQLLDAGASIDSVNTFGNTPLWVATMHSRGRGEVIELLLARGADEHRANNSGISPRELAKTIANHDVLQFYP